jgi:hypothetical protein
MAPRDVPPQPEP